MRGNHIDTDSTGVRVTHIPAPAELPFKLKPRGMGGGLPCRDRPPPPPLLLRKPGEVKTAPLCALPSAMAECWH